jgi:glycerol-3-phosphate dehydrogenase
LTDEPLDGPVPAVPEPTQAEIDWILGVISPWLARPLTQADVIGSFAGVRPLVSGGTGSSADLSRRHALIDHRDGRLTITGGKLTTYRRMAQEVVDAITHRPCSTTRIGLVGSGGTRSGSSGNDRLVRRYGNEASAVRDLGSQPLVDGLPALIGEAAFAVTHEGALSSEDVLERRLRLSFHPGWEDALPLVSGLLDAVPV